MAGVPTAPVTTGQHLISLPAPWATGQGQTSRAAGGDELHVPYLDSAAAVAWPPRHAAHAWLCVAESVAVARTAVAGRRKRSAR